MSLLIRKRNVRRKKLRSCEHIVHICGNLEVTLLQKITRKFKIRIRDCTFSFPTWIPWSDIVTSLFEIIILDGTSILVSSQEDPHSEFSSSEDIELQRGRNPLSVADHRNSPMWDSIGTGTAWQHWLEHSASGLSDHSLDSACGFGWRPYACLSK